MDIRHMMKQAQQMQERLKKQMDELRKTLPEKFKLDRDQLDKLETPGFVGYV